MNFLPEPRHHLSRRYLFLRRGLHYSQTFPSSGLMILIIILSEDFITFFILFFLILTLLHQPAYMIPFFISVSFQDYPYQRYQQEI